MMDWPAYALVAFSPPRVRVLERLGEGPRTPSQLAEETGMRRSHISIVLKDLREAGLIECLTPGRRRGVLYSLTEEGREVLREAPRSMGRYVEEEVARELDQAGIPYGRNLEVGEGPFEWMPDFVIPPSEPKVLVEVKGQVPKNPSWAERVFGFALRASQVRGKGLKAVLVFPWTSRGDAPWLRELVPQYLDAVFFKGELEAFVDFVRKCLAEK
jgi:DNA-binding MarR family transcriptional regulator